jgi:four helix bundle protein
MASSYRELKVWQKSIDLAEQVYRLTERFPPAELYGIANQMRRAAVSVASNIAEGWGRRSRREYSKFVVIARGSNDELQTQLVIAERLGFGESAARQSTMELSDEIGRMLNGLYTFLQRPKGSSREA